MANTFVGTHHGASEIHHTSEASGSPQLSRKSPRADFHDYSGGEYFVTICTQGKEHYFGEIVEGQMEYAVIGRFAVNALEELKVHYPYAEVVMSVVMPNHVHAIISIDSSEDAPWCVLYKADGFECCGGWVQASCDMFCP